jgi:hypothetical protein
MVDINELVGYVINHLLRKGERVRKTFLIEFEILNRVVFCIYLPKLDSSKTKVIMLQNPLLP